MKILHNLNHNQRLHIEFDSKQRLEGRIEMKNEKAGIVSMRQASFDDVVVEDAM